MPSVSRIGEITDLPLLIRKKLAEAPPSRSDIVSGYTSYLKPFMAASINNWTKSRSEKEIDGYVKLFAALGEYVVASLAQSRRANP